MPHRNPPRLTRHQISTALMKLGTFRDPEVLYEEEPEGWSRPVNRLNNGLNPKCLGTTAFTGLKKVSVRALRALVKNTPHEFVFDHPDDNETARKDHDSGPQNSPSHAEAAGPDPVRGPAEKRRRYNRLSSHNDKFSWHPRHPEPSNPRVKTAPQRRRSRLARHVRAPERVTQYGADRPHRNADAFDIIVYSNGSAAIFRTFCQKC